MQRKAPDELSDRAEEIVTPKVQKPELKMECAEKPTYLMGMLAHDVREKPVHLFHDFDRADTAEL